MGAVIKHILVGQERSFGSGIDPTHYLFLRDHDRPVWSIARFPDGHESATEPHYLIPRSPAFIGRDALVLIAWQVLADEGVCRVLRDNCGAGVAERRIDLECFAAKGLCDLDASIDAVAKWPASFAIDLERDEFRFRPSVA